MSKQENVDAILVGLEKTACLIDRCTIYELLYNSGDSAASKNLEKSILRLYTAILKFLAKAIRILNGEYSVFHHRPQPTPEEHMKPVDSPRVWLYRR